MFQNANTWRGCTGAITTSSKAITLFKIRSDVRPERRNLHGTSFSSSSMQQPNHYSSTSGVRTMNLREYFERHHLLLRPKCGEILQRNC